MRHPRVLEELEVHVKGAANKAKGAVKKKAGKATGDRKTEAEGRVDKTKGGNLVSAAMATRDKGTPIAR